MSERDKWLDVARRKRGEAQNLRIDADYAFGTMDGKRDAANQRRADMLERQAAEIERNEARLLEERHRRPAAALAVPPVDPEVAAERMRAKARRAAERREKDDRKAKDEARLAARDDRKMLRGGVSVTVHSVDFERPIYNPAGPNCPDLGRYIVTQMFVRAQLGGVTADGPPFYVNGADVEEVAIGLRESETAALRDLREKVEAKMREARDTIAAGRAWLDGVAGD